MTFVLSVLHRYVAPFFVGICLAATTVVSDVASVVALIAAVAAFGYLSLPAGGRMIARLTNAAV